MFVFGAWIKCCHLMGKGMSAKIKSVYIWYTHFDLSKLGKIWSYLWAMACSIIYFTLICFVVTLVMGNYYSTPDQIIQDRKKSLKDEKQNNTRKYQDFLDIILSFQVNLKFLSLFIYLVNCGGKWVSEQERRQKQNWSTKFNSDLEWMDWLQGFWGEDRILQLLSPEGVR